MKKFFLTSTIFFLIATPIIAAAYTLQVDYPAIPNVRPTTGLVDYIRYVYLFALGAVGLVAFGVMVYGGILYMMSGTNITSKNEAKSWFKAAISGLLLALASYLILNTINPNLVRIKAPTLPATEIPAPSGPTRTSTLQLGESCTPNVEPQCDGGKGLICQGGRCIQGPTAATLPAPSSSQYRWERTGSYDCNMFAKTNYNDNLCPQPKPTPEADYDCCGLYGPNE